MPELPEVETIVNALSGAAVGLAITGVEVFSPQMRTPLTPLLEAGLEGRTIESVRRRGRYLVAELSGGKCLVMHFGMSGVLRLESAEIPKRKHEHVYFHLSDRRILKFECPRRFSLVEACDLEHPGEEPEMLKGLGVEPLSAAFTPEHLYVLSRKSRAPVKVFIMDNSVVVGVGNIYAAESLFAAGIDPRTRSCDVTPEDFRKLAAAIRKVLKAAIEAGGTTFSDYRQLDGSEGKFERALQVYGREGAPCVRCGTLIANVKLGGRSSFYCPKCQINRSENHES